MAYQQIIGGRRMKLYRARTRKQYDWLMNKLEDDFRRWESGELMTEYDGFHEYGENTVIEDDRESGWGVLYSHIEDTAKRYPEVPIIEVSNLLEEQNK